MRRGVLKSGGGAIGRILPSGAAGHRLPDIRLMARDPARRRTATTRPQPCWPGCRMPRHAQEPRARCRSTGPTCRNRAGYGAIRSPGPSPRDDVGVERCRKSWGSPTRGQSRAMKRPSRTSGGMLAVTPVAVHAQQLGRRMIRPLGECSAGAAHPRNSGTSPDPGERARRVCRVPTRHRRSSGSRALDAAGTG